ncbi:hypothetical protein ACQ3JU_0370 (plasmid) [Bradyrhizobium guangxiense]
MKMADELQFSDAAAYTSLLRRCFQSGGSVGDSAAAQAS